MENKDNTIVNKDELILHLLKVIGTIRSAVINGRLDSSEVRDELMQLETPHTKRSSDLTN